MKITNYKFGKIEIDGNKYTNDLIIFPHNIKTNWWRAKGHFLQVQDLEDVFELQPKKLIVGKGYYGLMKISDKVKAKAGDLGVKLVAEKSKKACKLFNEEKNKDNLVFAIHLTC